MSSPHNPLELGGLFGDHPRVYPPAPSGMHYTDTHGLPSPPAGYHYANMKDVVKQHAPISDKHHYVFGAHTAEGIRERANEAIRISGMKKGFNNTGVLPGTTPGLTQTPTSPIMPSSPVPGMPIVPPPIAAAPPDVHIPLPTPRPTTSMPSGFADEIQKLLDPVPPPHIPLPTPRPTERIPLPTPRPAGKALSDMNINELRDLGNRIYRGENPTVKGLTDTTQSHMDAHTDRHRMVPAVLEQLMQNPTAPMGPAFDPHNVNPDELKYHPLPDEEEQ